MSTVPVVATAPETAPISTANHRRLEQALLVGPREDRLRLAVAAHLFRRHRLWREWGFVTQADYVRERLGQPLPAFQEWAAAGRILARLPAARRALRCGRLSLSDAALLGRRCSLTEAAELLPDACRLSHRRLRQLLRSRQAAARPPDRPAPEPDPAAREVTLNLKLPRSAVTYVEDTLELARALAGGDLSTADALATVLAEASTEIEAPPRRPFPVPRQLHPVCERRRRGQAPDRPDAGDPTLPRPADPRHLARRLDRRLRRTLRGIDGWTTRAEDLLLESFHADDHLVCGFTNFYAYVTQHFGVSRRAAIDMVERARLRRRHHPLAVARAEGRIGSVQALILRALEKIGVPRSALPAWIDRASRVTVRFLRRLVAWARRVARRDLRAWANVGYAPPDPAEVQTSEFPLSQIAADPTPPDPALLADEPLEPMRWQLDAADHALLLDLTHGIDATATRMRAPRPATWWKLVHIFHLARNAWRDAAKALPRHPHRAVLERDRYQCQVPGCSRRAVEVHHVEFRSHGGSDELTNLVCLCPEHHRHHLHAGRLRITGRVTDDRRHLRFDLGLGPDARPLLSYRGEEVVPTATPC